MKNTETKTQKTVSAKVVTAVSAQLPGMKKPQTFNVRLAQTSGNILFENERTTGIIDVKNKKFYYNPNGRSGTHRATAKELQVPAEVVKAFVNAIQLSALVEDN